MKKRDRNRIPEYQEINFDFRPSAYFADHSPIEAIVQNIKGQNRREMARDFIAGDMPKDFGEIDDRYLQDTIDDQSRVELGRINPAFMGGEYLPDYSPGEVEIARVVLQSSTQDVYSFRVRQSRPGTRYRYRLVDEYDEIFHLRPASSTRPLSLRQLIKMIDSVSSDGLDTMGYPFVEGFVAWQLESSESVWDATHFVHVESSGYPDLESYYAMRLHDWATQICEAREESE